MLDLARARLRVRKFTILEAKETKTLITNQTVLFHGTAREFDTFSISSERNATTPKDEVNAIFFADDVSVAQGHARRMARQQGGTPRLIRATLDFKNMFDATTAVKRVAKKFNTFGEAKRSVYSSVDRVKYDGIIFRGDSVNSPEYVVFDPNIIRVIKDKTIEANSNEYGAWITPGGKTLEVDFENHSGTADKYIAKSLYKEYSDYVTRTGIADSTAFCLEQGWIRIVNEGRIVSVQFLNKGISRKAYASLVSYVEDKNYDEFIVSTTLPSDREGEYKVFKLQNAEKKFAAFVRTHIDGSIVAELPLPKTEIQLDDANNVISLDNRVVESWESPEGFKIHLVEVVKPEEERLKFQILTYSPGGQLLPDVSEYAFLETARDGLLERVNDVRNEMIYSRIEASDGNPEPIERYETEDGNYALELSTQGKGFDVIQYQYNPIVKIWKKMGAHYNPKREGAEAHLAKLLQDLKSMKFRRVEIGVNIPKADNKGYKLFSKQPSVKGLEVYVQKISSYSYARVIHVESGRAVISFSNEPLKISATELVRRIDLSKDIASIDWTKSPVQLDQTYGQNRIANIVQRFKEGLEVALPASISVRSGKAELVLDQGLKEWVKDFLIARYFARPAAAKSIKENIDKKIEENSLNPDDVYNYYGNPDDQSQQVWEKIGLTRNKEGGRYVYEFANKSQRWTWATIAGKAKKAYFSVSVNGVTVADIAVADENIPKAIVDLGNGKTSDYKSKHFKDMSLVKRVQDTFPTYDIMANGKLIGRAYNPPFELRGILFKLGGGEIKKPEPPIVKTKTTVKPVSVETTKSNRMVGQYVRAINSKGKPVTGILAVQNTVKGRTSGTIFYLRAGKPVEEEVTKVYRVYENPDAALLKTYFRRKG